MPLVDIAEIISDFHSGISLEYLWQKHNISAFDWEFIRDNVPALSVSREVEQSVEAYNETFELYSKIDELEKEICALDEQVNFLIEMSTRRGVALNRIANVIEDIRFLEPPN